MATEADSRHEVRKKEAGAAGGESGARAHGSALGGEADSVLIAKLICKVPPYATTGVVFADNLSCPLSGTRCSARYAH
jgi:hypothetical protein